MAEAREREHEARRVEQERISAEIEACTRQVRRESRRISRRLHESLFAKFASGKITFYFFYTRKYDKCIQCREVIQLFNAPYLGFGG